MIPGRTDIENPQAGGRAGARRRKAQQFRTGPKLRTDNDEGDLETLQDADEARDEVIRVDAFSREKALRP